MVNERDINLTAQTDGQCERTGIIYTHSRSLSLSIYVRKRDENGRKKPERAVE